MRAKQTREQLEAALGFDAPTSSISNGSACSDSKGSFSNSLWTNTPVIGEIPYRLTITVELGLLALSVSLVVGIPVGVYAAVKHDTIGEYILRKFSLLELAIPSSCQSVPI
ncbi:hypothetical protein I3J27_33715 [Bradyrhizobium xenonodulans]|uniref:ABC transmembrane type-1 domain-containing protein n=1 Tax=Bradyrhizobium xenonodulans TaxID=2736875 RepID=A0ABY7MHL8_9BRAD|nr:hypothetical protein [Bradyrhizobium xenonodulans]WBL77887.1 hypothetical protein I3J27_33715 [Bradyrhizobium xenonodulans]